MSSGSLPAFRAISRYLNILRAGYGLYAIVRSSSSPLSSSVRSSRLSILCPWTVPCHRRKVVRASILPSKMYLPGSSRLCVEIENRNRNERSAHDRLYQNRSVHHNLSIENHSGLCRSLGHLLGVYGIDALYRPFRFWLCAFNEISAMRPASLTPTQLALGRV